MPAGEEQSVKVPLCNTVCGYLLQRCRLCVHPVFFEDPLTWSSLVNCGES